MRDATYKETKYSVEEVVTKSYVEPLRCASQTMSISQGAAKGAAFGCAAPQGAAKGAVIEKELQNSFFILGSWKNLLFKKILETRTQKEKERLLSLLILMPSYIPSEYPSSEPLRLP